MQLFPQTHEFILNELLKANAPNANLFYRILSRKYELFRNHSYEELLQAFNIFLNNLADEQEETDNESNDENSREIQSLIDVGEQLFRENFYVQLIASKYDVCALLLIIKKYNEVNLANIENAEDFINKHNRCMPRLCRVVKRHAL